ncbi:PD-(D/E)XK nuclease family protein [Candidatus Cloacimonadaceae bacterium]
MKILSIDFSSDLDKLVYRLAKPDSILIFPTRIAANRASLALNRNWDLQPRIFLSVEELREMLIAPPQPALTDEKRLLCLYLVMKEEMREFFHIFGYSDIVDWGLNFFAFWEELAEEAVEAESLRSLNDSGTFHLQEWQEIYLQKILQIRQDYYNYITALGFTDKIFFLRENAIQVPWTNHDIIYVNQYYYSALEKAQLQALENAGNRITLITQGFEFGLEKELKKQEFDLQAAWDKLIDKPSLQILESENETSMALAFLAWKEENRNQGIIIDSGLTTKSYSRYFQQPDIAMPQRYSIEQSSIYRLLSLLTQSLRYVVNNGGFLPIKLLSACLCDLDCVRYFLDIRDGDLLAQQSLEIRNELAALLQEDYLYVDEQLFDDKPETPLKKLVLGLFELLAGFSAVDSISSLCRLFGDSKSTLSLSRLYSDFEKVYTDLEEVFGERLANFAAIDSLGLVQSWNLIFPSSELGLSLLELLLSYLKSGRISYQRLGNDEKSWEIGNLLDARNRSFETVVFLQMIEGILPAAPTPVWLFSEAQRAKLGLKTYADIRGWERYYFFRLLFTAKRGICFCYNNLDRDISSSSFLGELSQLLHADLAYPSLWQKVQISVSQLYQDSFGTNHPFGDSTSCFQAKPAADFFVIPCQPALDLKSGILALGASSLLQLLKNPFIWFVEYNCNARRLDWEADEKVTGKLFGNIMHAYFAFTLGELHGRHDSLDRLQALLGNPERLEREFRDLIKSPKLRYQIPKNYNADFLADILSCRLSESLNIFYSTWLSKNLQNRSFVLIPETEGNQMEESGYKCLGKVLLAGSEYKLATRGKADLRIELEDSALIVDFKTGGYDKRQLAIYEWFYYLIDNYLPESALSSVFWKIMDAEPESGLNPEKRAQAKAQILDAFRACLEQGFGMGSKATERIRLPQITRLDLFNALSTEDLDD